MMEPIRVKELPARKLIPDELNDILDEKRKEMGRGTPRQSLEG